MMRDRRAVDRQRILFPAMWPRWPYLPIKRTTKEDPMETAVLLMQSFEGNISEDAEITVHLVGYYQMKAGVGVKGAEILTYSNIDAFLDDGWIID